MEDLKQYPISIGEVIRARQMIATRMPVSQLIYYPILSQVLGFDVYVKHENQNVTGSFKIRGGLNVMAHIQAKGIAGVVTFSTGNHGLSVAYAAKQFGLPAIVVVPEGANPAKMRLMQAAGATVLARGKNFDESALVVADICTERGYYYIHPANEPHLINGVGSEFIEVLEQQPDINAVILPLGGGSEVAAASVVFQALKPQVEIYAVQAKASSAAYQSWKSQQICQSDNQTFAGGFATGTAYELTFGLYRRSLSDFVLLQENEILQGIALAGHYTHQLLEGAGASTLMAAIKLRTRLRGKKVMLQFSGANASSDEIQQAYGLPEFSQGIAHSNTFSLV
ncbi:L-threonine ammonia-lyase [Vibrio stylophorae]|uniref:L-threonine ammonia-lyase n=1 Tax=Vibrio stylophorae TaxID=659351 RepID=A0ABN8DNX7_9VIBR|nr:pyridoxal-phosphate dependent enzyme [Vibrio stylophorae]CAH0532906.1 L-threonine ammonia-lyase [Vibrio stylophorae]